MNAGASKYCDYTGAMQGVRQILAFTLVPLAVAILFNGVFWLFYNYVQDKLAF